MLIISFDSSNVLILFFDKDEIYIRLPKICDHTPNRLDLTDKLKIVFFVSEFVKQSIL